MNILKIRWVEGTVGVLLALVLLCGPLLASAATVVRSGESISLAEDQMVSGDFYAAGRTVSISGTVDGDLYTAGGTVTINGKVEQDVVIAGGTVYVQYPVGDDVRIAGGQIIVGDRISGDLVVLGGSLSVLSTAVIEGDVLFYGGKADIEGNVGGSIRAGADTLRIDSVVDGDVTATIGHQFTLGPTADIEGNVSYKSADDLVRSPGSIVVGDVNKSELYEVSVTHPSDRFPVLRFFTTLFAALVLLLLFSRHIRMLTEHIGHSFGVYGLIGLGVFFVTPLVAFLLMVTVLGAFVGALVMAAYMALLLISWILTGIFVGAAIARFFTKKYKVTWLWTLAGVGLIHLVIAVPFVGPFAIFVLFLMTLGGLASVLYKKIR